MRPSVTAAPGDLTGKRILLVDDESFMRQIIKRILRADGGCSQLEEASDGAAGLKMLKSYKADVVLVDIDMSPVGGIEFLCLVRSGREPGVDRRTPILMMSSDPRNDTVLRAMVNGAHGFVRKPFSQRVIIDRVPPLALNPPDFVRVQGTGGRDFFGPLTTWSTRAVVVKALKEGRKVQRIPATGPLQPTSDHALDGLLDGDSNEPIGTLAAEGAA